MGDTIKVRLAEDKRIEEENCVDDPSNAKADNPSNAKANVNTIPINNDDTLYYITKSRVRKAHFDSTGAITKDEIEAGMLDLPAAIANKNSQLTCKKANCKSVVTGKSVSWVPRTHELEVKNRPGQTVEEHNIMSRLNKLFDSEISTWSYNASG